ncbi:RNA polymerase sigma factor [Mesoterricola silvestris]|nr:RNA polymerase sigma factor [Mesoterricola silvestris]
MASPEPIPLVLDALYRGESRQVLATLIRLLGDFDAAEEAMHEAFRAALEQWPVEGVPARPRAWLVSTGRFKAIDALRRRAKFEAPLDALGEALLPAEPEEPDGGVETLPDDRLRLVFTCCHPLLGTEACVALTLREVCGLTTEEIARAFLVAPSTMAQRIVRAKAKIRNEGLPYEVPGAAELPGRLEAVLQVIYLVFNEGYSASSGQAVTRTDLSGEAIRLGRLLAALLPAPEVHGLLALMLFHESRRAARTSPSGDLVLLADQDRSLWNRALIQEGSGQVARALGSRRAGRYTLEAAIAAAHARAPGFEATPWGRIVGFYELLVRLDPSPVIRLNRAVAVAFRDGPGAGLALVDGILEGGELATYHLAHSARADFCRQLGRMDDARASYRTALSLARQDPERRFLEGRLEALG